MRKCNVVVDKILYHNEETAYSVFQGIVLRWAPRKKMFVPTRETHTFVGQFCCLFLGDRYEVEVEEITNPVHGPQYSVVTSKRIEPVTLTEIREFLGKNVKGMTEKRLDAILDKYGTDAISCLINEPHAYDFLKLPQDAVSALRASLTENAAFECVIVYLQLHKLDCRYARPLYDKYRDRTTILLNDNPYLPFIDGIFSFQVADKLYLTLQKPADSPKRCVYVALATIQMDAKMKGNVFTKESELKQKMMFFLMETAKTDDKECFPFTDNDIENAIAKLENRGLIVLDNSYTSGAIYLRSNYVDEQKIASCIQQFLLSPKKITFHESDIETFLVQYEKQSGLKLDFLQKKAVKTALMSPLTVISGGPGTGKTQTINAIKAAAKALVPSAKIRACAPTGKAAIRLQELTGISAGTIHRTVGFGKFKEALKSNELDCDYMFVDEFSMVDVHLCAKLFDAVTSSGRIILVGDYYQLPSVGPGLVLRDIIMSDVVPKVMLNQVFRQAEGSRIIRNAHAIINQKANKSLSIQLSERAGEDFYFIMEQDPIKVMKLLKQSIFHAKKQYGYGLDAVQVLSPVHFGLLGTDHINSELQKLNDTRVCIDYEDRQFRIGDKVAHIENDYQLEVFNGEIGFITEITFTKERSLKVSYPDRDVWYSFSALSELDLAYSLTVHKMQGSEYPVIIMPIHEVQGRGLSKNLIYTALTRAKRMIVLIGSPSALATGLRRETSIDRKSNLIMRLKELMKTEDI